MKRYSALIVIAMAFGICHRAQADDGRSRWWNILYPAHREQQCCPDDYCPKPPPPCPTKTCLGCDDYCRKPLPCVAPVRCFNCEDYCRKPYCIQFLPCYPSWYTCGPTCDGCSQKCRIPKKNQ